MMSENNGIAKGTLAQLARSLWEAAQALGDPENKQHAEARAFLYAVKQKYAKYPSLHTLAVSLLSLGRLQPTPVLSLGGGPLLPPRPPSGAA